ncbi:MAG: hypothetical protein D6770_09895 [Anaerolineae bacterium]|nr:MAG: hypothetical protein D6770_09895 [Anaerolineae bacterium]
MLRVQLFGTPTVSDDDRPLRVRRRLPRLLLFYLAAGGAAVGRDQIATLFWPHIPNASARRRLRETLSQLRTALPDPGVILTPEESIALDLHRVDVDVLTFRSLLHKAGRAPWLVPDDSPLPPDLHQTLVQAASLWRGPRLLDGVDLSLSAELEDWHRHLENSLQLEFLPVLKRLARHETVVGNPVQAVQWLSQALEIDEFNEELHLALLTALLELGWRDEARQHYRKLETLLQRELGTSPSAQIQALRPRIFDRDGEFTLPVEITWPTHTSLRVPFIGRDDILKKMQQAYNNGESLLLVGEAGVGKTRLVQEFYRRLRPTPRLLIASCTPQEKNLPYQPWIEMLRHGVYGDEWRELPEIWLGYLSLLLPELIADYGKRVERPVWQPGQSRGALFEAVRQVLSHLTENRPLLVFLDDAHWADESTLAIAAYLLNEGLFSGGRGMLILAARAEESNPQLERLAVDVSLKRLSRLEVRRLNQDEIAELTYHVFGKMPSPTFLERVTRDTGGNPLFLLEMLRALLATQSRFPFRESEGFLPLPKSVQDLIRERLQRLSALAREVVTAAAVLGSRFDVRILEAVCPFPPAETARALEELEDDQLIRLAADGKPGPQYTFVHEKIREAILNDLSAARKRLYHHKCARALEKRLGGHGGPRAAVVAEHYESAGDPENAFLWWSRAAEHAYRLSSLEDATAAFRRAEQLIPHCDNLDEEAIYHLYQVWNDMAFETSDTDTLWRINRDLLHLGEERNSPLLIGSALDGLSDACLSENKFQEGLEYTRRAEGLLARSGNLFEYMEILSHRGVFEYMLGYLKEAITSFHAALALCENIEEPLPPLVLRARGNAHYQLGLTHTLTGWPQIGWNHAERSLQDYILCNNPYGQAMAYSVLSLAGYFLGDYTRACHENQKGMELAERIGGWRVLGHLSAYRSLNELALGHLGLAWRYAQKALTISERHGHYETTSIAYRVLGDIHYYLQDPAKAEEFYRKGIEAARGHFAALDSLARLGNVLMRRGQQMGKTHLSQAIAQAEERDLASISLPARVHHIFQKAHVEPGEETHREIESLLQETEQRALKVYHLTLEYLRARLALREGKENPETILYHLEDLAADVQRTENPWLGIQIRILQAEVLHRLAVSDLGVRQILHTLLDKLEDSIGDAPLWEAWTKYRQAISSLQAL